MQIEKYSMGVGDRFTKQAKAQLKAIMKANELGVELVPVWNKSHREHTIIKTTPESTRKSADEAVEALSWTGSYYLDADHINLSNVDLFVDYCNFFTLDVADYIKPEHRLATDDPAVIQFVSDNSQYIGPFSMPGSDASYTVTEEQIREIACQYLTAVRQAGKIYRHVEAKLGADNFVTEVSMDETDIPQGPIELFFILAMVAGEKIPAQTIAPRFSGRFNKGVEYVGDPEVFAKEFEADTIVLKKAVQQFGLPDNIKLSVHSGSDKFAIYPKISEILKKHGSGLHLKTAGTTWLEEIIGLALAGGEGLAIAKDIYRGALGRFDELCGPYASVIDINPDNLPPYDVIADWSGEKFAASVRHDQSCPDFNPDIRQLLHVGYKVAVEMGDRFYNALEAHEDVIAEQVTVNILERHIQPLFLN